MSSVQLPSMSACLQWLSMEREQGDRDGSLGGPSMMDYTAESRPKAVTAGSVRHVRGRIRTHVLRMSHKLCLPVHTG